MSRKAVSQTPIKARLYLESALSAGLEPALSAGQAHYLRSVLRLTEGQSVGLFNGRDGEWRAELLSVGRSGVRLRTVERRRAQQAGPDIRLCFAPLKKSAVDIVAAKATELGAGRLSPVFTDHTAAARINTQRLRANAIEAAEQCERLDVPAVDKPVRLENLLEAWPEERPLLVCAEAGGAVPLAEAAADLGVAGYGILIGPEGGFSIKELDRLSRLAFVRPVGLGPRILKADTAALAALAICQAITGDFEARPPEEASFYSRQDRGHV